jgi:hypothetical protein
MPHAYYPLFLGHSAAWNVLLLTPSIRYCGCSATACMLLALYLDQTRMTYTPLRSIPVNGRDRWKCCVVWNTKAVPYFFLSMHAVAGSCMLYLCAPQIHTTTPSLVVRCFYATAFVQTWMDHYHYSCCFLSASPLSSHLLDYWNGCDGWTTGLLFVVVGYAHHPSTSHVCL